MAPLLSVIISIKNCKCLYNGLSEFSIFKRNDWLAFFLMIALIEGLIVEGMVIFKLLKNLVI